MNKEENIFVLSKQDTNVIKGIAIVAMLCHHVYTCLPNWIEPYPEFLTQIGILGKVCVAMFLFCSGYGLSVQYEKVLKNTTSIADKLHTTIVFILKRFVKFYSAYWFVFLIFVPITVLFFDRPLSAAYGDHVNILKRLLFDILGLQGRNSYNITWWFNKLIIIFYIVFPVFYIIIKKIKLLGILLSFVAMLLAYDFDILNYYDTIFWQFPFILGIGWYMYQDKFECISKLVGRYGLWFRIGSVLLLCFGVLQRLYNIMSISGITSVRFDGLLTVIVVLCVICVLRKCNILYTILMFLGKHSMNIYMVHTFLNVYWVVVRKWLHTIDTCRAYGINMWILLVSCLLISMMIDMVKEKCYWNNLTSKIIELIK